MKAAETDAVLRYPGLDVTLGEIESRFAGTLAPDAPRAPLRNPHHEPKVTAEQRRHAVPAAVLIPFVGRPGGAAIVLTRRHEAISFPGHICFPGGRADPGDPDAVHTALREAWEEIGLAADRVRLVGRLGDYVSHSGFRIAPILGVVAPGTTLRPAPGEVEEILEIPLAHVLDARSYRLQTVASVPSRGYYLLESAGARVAGPTVALLIGLYEALLAR